MKQDKNKKKATRSELKAHIAGLEKELAQAKDYKDMWHKSNQEKEKQINSIHAALDVFPFAPRTVEVKGKWSTDTVEVSVEGRVMAILGQAAGILNYQRKTDVSTVE